MTASYDCLAKSYRNSYGHMTKMATTPYMVKYLLLWNQKVIGFGIWYVALGMWALLVCTNDESTLTYFMARSNLIPNAFIWGKS